MDECVKTVLDFMTAAQTVLAVYASPDGPTDPKACYDIMAELLEDPALLRAQTALAPGIILFFGEQKAKAPVLALAG